MSSQEACKVLYLSPCDSNGDSKQILGTAPDDQEQPYGCCVDRVWQCAVQQVYARKYHTGHLPVAWRNQYNLTHTIVPESPRAILLDLENLEKVFAERSNEAARANKAKVAAAAKSAGDHVPRKVKRAHGGGPDKGNPKKGRTDKFCKWCKAVDGPFTTHNTTECRRFNKDGSQKDRPTKPFDSAEKTWKKPGGGNSDQMSPEEMAKLKKKLKKSKKYTKRARTSMGLHRRRYAP